MQAYVTKEELLTAIQTAYQRFDQEFDAVPEAARERRFAAGERTPQEMLAYQLGWLTLILGWEAAEQAGQTVITPAPEYKWNQLGQLYQHFYKTYAAYSLQELRALFKQRVDEWCQWIYGLSEAELFTPNQRCWTVTAANWPLVKWIHINSVAPFKSFRTQIRKWKKQAASQA